MTTTQASRPSLIMRNDTLLGVCQGLGEDLGISGNWFRIAFALALFFSPPAAIAAYLVAGVLVLATRLLIPVPREAADVVSFRAEAPMHEEKADELLLAA